MLGIPCSDRVRNEAVLRRLDKNMKLENHKRRKLFYFLHIIKNMYKYICTYVQICKNMYMYKNMYTPVHSRSKQVRPESKARGR